ncbi:hypothetical protein R6Q57_028393 [Mikania cordata]
MKQFQMSKQSRRKRWISVADITGDLPIYNPASAAGQKESQSWRSRSEMSYKLIHLIPVVVIVCFFILWCFSSPVDLETKDGRTTLVPRTKNKKSLQRNESADLDLTVLTLGGPPDGFLSVSDGPYALLPLPNQPNVSLLDSHDHSASSTDSHVQNASLSVSHGLKAPFSDNSEPKKLSVDLHESNEPISDDVKLLLPGSDEPRLLYPGKSNNTAPQASGKGKDLSLFFPVSVVWETLTARLF